MGWSPRSEAAASDGAGPSARTDSFPLWIALCSTAAAVALFFTCTAPALTENESLRDIETDRAALVRTIRAALERDSWEQLGLEFDLQCLLVELDRRGVAGDALLDQILTDNGLLPAPHHGEVPR